RFGDSSATEKAERRERGKRRRRGRRNANGKGTVMLATKKIEWAAQLRWATLAALGTAALVVGGNEAQAQDETGAVTSYDFTPIMAVEAVRDPAITARKIADQPVTVEKTDTVQDAIAKVVVSDQR